MAPFSDVKRYSYYDPDTLRMMTAAFDRAFRFLPADLKTSEEARRKLALLIRHHVDQGEHDPQRISDAVWHEFLRWSAAR